MEFILLASSLFSEINVYEVQGRCPPSSPLYYACKHLPLPPPPHTKSERGEEEGENGRDGSSRKKTHSFHHKD